MKKPYTAPVVPVLSQPRAVPPARDDARNYHGVAICYYDPCACHAVQRLETRPFLSDRPPLFLETTRFLAGEAPLLPLPNCTAPHCLCRYAHYEDRRERDRRDPLSRDIALAPLSVSFERRSGINRRGFCSTTDRPAVRPVRAIPG